VADAVTEAGLVPVLCDVGPDWNVEPSTIESVLTARTGAIVLVHVFGIAANVRDVERFGLPVVEDTCQAFGGTDHGRPLGTLGALGVFSFQATKCLATGEGGFVCAREPETAARLRELADGCSGEFTRSFSPLTDLQAALGLSQLARYDEFLARRRALADRYFDALGDLPIELPRGVRDRSMFFRFPVRVHGTPFEATQARFQAAGVHVRRGVDALLHRTIGAPGAAFPNAERLYEETVSLPIYPALTDAEQDVVIRACRDIWKDGASAPRLGAPAP
jgi:UDP-4-amino-4-deoxy-L-arabinose-oxoglutarate aminotransferase